MRRRIRRRLRRRYTKRQLHNMRAIFLRIVCLVVLFLIIFGIVQGVRTIKKHHLDKKAARTEAIKQEIAADQEEKAKEEAKNRRVSLVMVGDVLLHESIENRSEQADGSYDYSDLFSEMKDEIQAADVALVNQEVIIGGDNFGVRGYPSFNAPSDLTDDLADAGFDVVLHATNHATDMGSTGISNCLDIWKEKHPEIEVLGIHASENDAQQVYVMNKEGIRIAFLNYTSLLNNELKEENSYMVDKLSDNRVGQVRTDIQNAKELADFVVVCPHWGTEDSWDITTQQKEWTQIFLEEGVDLVIGTHPHVIQPIEMLTDESTGHEMLVYYSIGNYCSWVSNGNDTSIGHIVGGMPQVEIGQKEDGTIGVLSYSVRAMVCQYTGKDDDVVVYPFAEYTDELANTHHIKDYSTNFSCEYVKAYLDRIWGTDWK